MKSYFGIVLLVAFVYFCQSNASEGTYPPTPVASANNAWNAPVRTSVGWNASPSPSPNKTAAIRQWEEKKYPIAKEQNVLVNANTKIIPPVGPPKVFVSARPIPQHDFQININQNHQEEYTSTFDRKTTYTVPAPPTILHQQPKVVDWGTPVWQIPGAPIVQNVPMHHGNSPIGQPPSYPNSYVFPAPRRPDPQPQGHGYGTVPQPPPARARPVPDPIPARFSFGTCAPPLHVLDFTWDSEGYRNRGVETFYTPLSHRQTVKSFHRAITGFNLRLTDTLDDVCLTTALNWNDLSAVITTFGTNTENYKCSFLGGGNKFALECVPVPVAHEGGEAFRTYFTKSDDKTYMVAYHCWESGSVEWFTFSNTNTLPHWMKREILDHVESLGFNPDEYQETDYSRCFPGSGSEGTRLPDGHRWVSAPGSLFSQCLPPKFIEEFYYDSALYQLKRKEEFYMPLVGSGGFSSISEFITGNHFSSSEATRRGFCSKYELDWRNLDSRFLESTDQTGRMERLSCRFLKSPNSNRDLHAMDCFRDNGSPVFRNYVTLTDHATYFLTKHCWHSGHTTWVLYSSSPKVSRDLKQRVLDHVRELGFNSDYQETTYSSCPGEKHVHHQHSVESETEYETDTLGSSTALFPRCSPPSSFLRRYTWESSSNNQGIEFFDVAMAHPKAAEIYRESLGQQIKSNTHLTNGYGFSESASQSPNCLRFRINHDTNITRHIGYGETVSNDFVCTYAANQEWILECISKSSPWLSYRNYGIKSDNLSWILTYQCLNSGAVPGSWTLWVAPGTHLTQQTKSGILRTVESLGFNGNDYVEFGSHLCTYKNRLYTQRTCDCCTEANARYI